MLFRASLMSKSQLIANIKRRNSMRKREREVREHVDGLKE